MKVSVVGAGYVGLVTAAVLADQGHEITCVEIDEDKVDKLKRGQVPFVEKDLSKVVARGMRHRKLSFCTNLKVATEWADIIMICVGTPTRDDGYPDMAHYEAVVDQLCECLTGPKTVVNKSTVPMGTARRVEARLRSSCSQPDTIHVISNPEFLREGTAIHDMYHGDRIVIGTNQLDVQMQMMELYAKLSSPVHICSPESAEMIKYASNAFLATKISFINAISELCEVTGADVEEVAAGIGADQRIGTEFLKPGLGYGGSCFGKDVQALISTCKMYEVPFGIIESTVAINARQPYRLALKLEDALGKLDGREIAIWGLAFKPDTDDMRDARSLDFIKFLLDRGAHVRAYDPAAYSNAFRLLPDVQFFMNPYDCARGADALCLLTEWQEFAKLDLESVRRSMAHPIMLDCRNAYDANKMWQSGWDYSCVGKTPPKTLTSA